MPIKITPPSRGTILHQSTTAPAQTPKIGYHTGSRTLSVGSGTTRSDLISAAQQEHPPSQGSATSEDAEVFHDPVLLSEADYEKISSLAWGEEIFKNYAAVVEKKYSKELPIDAFSILAREVNKTPPPFIDQKSKPEAPPTSSSGKKISFKTHSTPYFSTSELKLSETLVKALHGSIQSDPAIFYRLISESKPFLASFIDIFSKALNPATSNLYRRKIIEFEFEEQDISKLAMLSKKMEPILEKYLTQFESNHIKLEEDDRKFNFHGSMMSTDSVAALRFGLEVLGRLKRRNCEESATLSGLLRSTAEITIHVKPKEEDTLEDSVTTAPPTDNTPSGNDDRLDLLSTVAIDGEPPRVPEQPRIPKHG